MGSILRSHERPLPALLQSAIGFGDRFSRGATPGWFARTPSVCREDATLWARGWTLDLAVEPENRAAGHPRLRPHRPIQRQKIAKLQRPVPPKSRLRDEGGSSRPTHPTAVSLGARFESSSSCRATNAPAHLCIPDLDPWPVADGRPLPDVRVGPGRLGVRCQPRCGSRGSMRRRPGAMPMAISGCGIRKPGPSPPTHAGERHAPFSKRHAPVTSMISPAHR
jgi:hypothetical protein